MKTTFLSILTAATIASTGCNGDTVKVYKVASNESASVQAPVPIAPAAQTAPATTAAANSQDAAPFKYTLPPGWQETTPGEMRAASFIVANPHGRPGDVGVIPMPSDMSQLALVNMWREQLSLPDISAKDAADAATAIKIDANPGQMFDIVSTAKLVDGKSKARILVAMTTVGGMNWFFKMVGDDAFVESQKPAFAAFLKSVAFGGLPAPSTMDLSKLPASHPALPSMMPGAAGLPGAASDDAGKPKWTVPADWETAPGTQFSIAKFAAKGNGGAKADITVSALGGDGGGLLPNANRWRGSLGLGNVTQAELDKLVAKISVSGVEASAVDFTGSDLASGDAARLIVVAVPTGGQTWFYKITGDAGVVTQQKDAFLKFVASAKYPDAN